MKVKLKKQGELIISLISRCDDLQDRVNTLETSNRVLQKHVRQSQKRNNQLSDDIRLLKKKCVGKEAIIEDLCAQVDYQKTLFDIRNDRCNKLINLFTREPEEEYTL